MKIVRDVTGKNTTLTPNASPKATRKSTKSSFGRYQTGKTSGKKYPIVNPTFVMIANITTLNIKLGYLYKSASHSIMQTARNELIAKILKNKNVAATAAALELYAAVDPGG